MADPATGEREVEEKVLTFRAGDRAARLEVVRRGGGRGRRAVRAGRPTRSRRRRIELQATRFGDEGEVVVRSGFGVEGGVRRGAGRGDASEVGGAASTRQGDGDGAPCPVQIGQRW